MSDRGLRFRLGVWLAVALVCASAAAASGPLFPGAQYDVGWYPMSVAIGDLNGDDCLDLAAANNMSDNVSVLLSNGDGTFAAAVHYDAGSAPYSVAAGDLDRDGWLDLAVANEGSRNVSVLLNNGDGTFAEAVHYQVGRYPVSVAIGDLDGDDWLDLAVAKDHESTDTVSVLLNNGDGTFAPAVH